MKSINLRQKKTWKKTVRVSIVDGDIARVPLTRGYFSIIDARDAPIVDQWNWCAHVENGRIYACGFVDGKGRSLHSFLTEYDLCDHADGDGLNNRRSNLRDCSPSENARNRRKRKYPSSSKYKGVSFRSDRGTWLSCIRCDGILYKIGTFHKEEDAARAYDAKAKVLFGRFAVLNFGDGRS